MSRIRARKKRRITDAISRALDIPSLETYHQTHIERERISITKKSAYPWKYHISSRVLFALPL